MNTNKKMPLALCSTGIMFAIALLYSSKTVLLHGQTVIAEQRTQSEEVNLAKGLVQELKELKQRVKNLENQLERHHVYKSRVDDAKFQVLKGGWDSRGEITLKIDVKEGDVVIVRTTFTADTRPNKGILWWIDGEVVAADGAKNPFTDKVPKQLAGALNGLVGSALIAQFKISHTGSAEFWIAAAADKNGETVDGEGKIFRPAMEAEIVANRSEKGNQ